MSFRYNPTMTPEQFAQVQANPWSSMPADWRAALMQQRGNPLAGQTYEQYATQAQQAMRDRLQGTGAGRAVPPRGNTGSTLLDAMQARLDQFNGRPSGAPPPRLSNRPATQIVPPTTKPTSPQTSPATTQQQVWDSMPGGSSQFLLTGTRGMSADQIRNITPQQWQQLQTYGSPVARMSGTPQSAYAQTPEGGYTNPLAAGRIPMKFAGIGGGSGMGRASIQPTGLTPAQDPSTDPSGTNFGRGPMGTPYWDRTLQQFTPGPGQKPAERTTKPVTTTTNGFGGGFQSGGVYG